MTPTTDFLCEQFKEFNSSYFGNILPLPRFVVTHAQTFLGKFIYRRNRQWWPLSAKDYTIRISDYYDLPKREYQNTLLHEMIHYYIMYKHIKDTSPHGKVFRAMMQELNDKGWDISVRGNTKSYDIADKHAAGKVRTVVALHTTEGKHFVSVVNPKFVGRLENAINRLPNVDFHKWLTSSDAYFRDFPSARSLRGRIVDEETFKRIVNDETTAK